MDIGRNLPNSTEVGGTKAVQIAQSARSGVACGYVHSVVGGAWTLTSAAIAFEPL